MIGKKGRRMEDQKKTEKKCYNSGDGWRKE